MADGASLNSAVSIEPVRGRRPGPPVYGVVPNRALSRSLAALALSLALILAFSHSLILSVSLSLSPL